MRLSSCCEPKRRPDLPVTLIFHLEPTKSGTPVWWTESPDLPGFYATREHLAEVLLVSEIAVTDALRDQDLDTSELQFRYVLADEFDTSSGVDARIEPDESLAEVA
jgi:hypothetical protein